MAVLELEAAVTERGQTTVPAAIRKALHIGKRGVVVFRLSENGEVTLASKADEEPQDPIVENFLAFLAKDMLSSPGRLQPVTAEWVEKIQSLVAGVEVDLDQPLSDDEE
jgi:antitoxin PrlF